MATPDLIRLDIVVDEEQYDTVAGLLVRNISYGWEEDSLPTGETRFRVHCDNAIVQENLLSALRAWLPGLDVEAGFLLYVHTRDHGVLPFFVDGSVPRGSGRPRGARTALSRRIANLSMIRHPVVRRLVLVRPAS